MIKWDLLRGEHKFINVKNDYGYCTVKIIDGKIEEYELPKKPRIRFQLYNTNNIEFENIINK
ncbi:MAG: hypothetical protein HC905_23745 [Bacteroidales bacterium]|nr:hypothetical protein [Bacteroidales bacterium]